MLSLYSKLAPVSSESACTKRRRSPSHVLYVKRCVVGSKVLPELPEVETVVRGLRTSMLGRYIERLSMHRPDLRWPIPTAVSRLEGQKIVDVRRVAKTVVVVGEKQDGWLLHLGMSGRLLILESQAVPPAKHDHVEIFLQNSDGIGTKVVFNDPRRFGAFDYFSSDENLASHERLKNFGVDPTTQALTAQWLFDQTRGRVTSLKSFLLDQRLIAGLGNIYVSEALHRAQLHPAMKTGALDLDDCDRLVIHIKATLDDAIAAGGSSLRDYVQADGELGYFQHQWRVYGKQGEACGTCASAIEKIVQQGRSSFFCPACQKQR